jgi:hypothetical protein
MKMNSFLVGLAFVTAILSMRSPVRFPTIPNSEDDWPITDYERGLSTSPKKIRDRYRSQPPMRRLMRDLHRAAARDDAEHLLLARIPDADLRDWVENQIRQDRINRLSIFVQPGIPDETIIAAWRAELDAQKLEEDSAADEAATNANILRALIKPTSKDSASRRGVRT